MAMAVNVLLMVRLPCLFGLTVGITRARAGPNIECRKKNAECRIKTDTWSTITGCEQDHGYCNERSDFERVYGNRRAKWKVEGGRYMNTQKGTEENIDEEDDSLFYFYILLATKRSRRPESRLSHSFDSL
ncbi:MAG: hypothetical protein RRA15_08470 [bacterium]|nr:hypothetical protein [bacterium]MDT8366514.1 hypothetical protein [bacterium]